MELEHTYIIEAPIALVWEALVDPTHIEQWGGGPAVMSDEEHTEFSLWGSDIYGTNVEVIPHELLRQEWYAGDWDEPSHTAITLTAKNGGTIIDLKHTGIPEDQFDAIKEGWNEEYMEPLKEYVEDLFLEDAGDLDELLADEEL